MAIVPRSKVDGRLSRLMKVTLVLWVCLGLTAAWAQYPVYEYIDYTVKKGGTLWDISTEVLENAFLWPKVWQVNPEIENADLIYPGQVIRIPISLLKPELRPGTPRVVAPAVEMPKPESARKPAPLPGNLLQAESSRELASLDMIASAGFITDDLNTISTVVGAPGDETIFGKYDDLYIKATGASVGQRYSIYRLIKKIKHPVTKEKLGALYEVQGSIEITETGSKVDAAEVVESYSEIELGSLVGEYVEQESPIVGEHARTPDMNGYVLFLKSMKEIGALYDGVYLDLGAVDGIQIGDTFSVIRQDKRFTDRPIAKVEVIRVMDRTSTAFVLDSVQEISAGDVISLYREN